MIFAEHIATILNAASALSTALSGNISSYHVPDNNNLAADYLVFNYKLDDTLNSLQSKNILEYYTLYLVVLSPSTETLENIEILARALFDDYQDSYILDSEYNNTTNGSEAEIERYYKIIEYKITFKPL